MNGLWKEKLGGWNAKGCRRKSQSRKNTLRDKGRALIHAQDKRKDVGIWEEGDIEYINKEPSFKYSDWSEIWSVAVAKDINYSKSFYAILYKDVWYDYITYEMLKEQQLIKKLDFIEKEEFQFENPIERKNDNGYLWASAKSTMFIYGKPISNWKRLTFYNDGKRRKIAQKIASSKDRALLRTWINKGDWDAEIGSHALSKSILWEIW